MDRRLDVVGTVVLNDPEHGPLRYRLVGLIVDGTGEPVAAAGLTPTVEVAEIVAAGTDPGWALDIARAAAGIAPGSVTRVSLARDLRARSTSPEFADALRDAAQRGWIEIDGSSGLITATGEGIDRVATATPPPDDGRWRRAQLPAGARRMLDELNARGGQAEVGSIAAGAGLRTSTAEVYLRLLARVGAVTVDRNGGCVTVTRSEDR